MKSFIAHESYYNCDCGSEVALIRKYKDETQVELSIYKLSPRLMDWCEQLRWIWHIACNKNIWSDQIILDKESAERMGAVLIALANGVDLYE